MKAFFAAWTWTSRVQLGITPTQYITGHLGEKFPGNLLHWYWQLHCLQQGVEPNTFCNLFNMSTALVLNTVRVHMDAKTKNTATISAATEAHELVTEADKGADFWPEDQRACAADSWAAAYRLLRRCALSQSAPECRRLSATELRCLSRCECETVPVPDPCTVQATSLHCVSSTLILLTATSNIFYSQPTTASSVQAPGLGPLHVQARNHNRRPNLALVFYVYFV